MFLALIALCISVAVGRETFISLQDLNFDREDPRIALELKRRMNHDDLIRAFKPSVRTPQPSVPNTRSNASRTTLPPVTNYRRNNAFGTATATFYPRDIVQRASRHKMIEIAEQAFYSAQYRIRELQPYTTKYLEAPEFRISFILKRLETFELELEILYSYMFNQGQLWNEYQGSKLNVFTFIVYYQRVLMRNIDVRYMVERLFTLHHEVEKNKALVRERMQVLKNTTTPQGGTNSSGGSTPEWTTPPGWSGSPPPGFGLRRRRNKDRY